MTPSRSYRTTAASDVWYNLKWNHKQIIETINSGITKRKPAFNSKIGRKSTLPSTHRSDRILLPSGLRPPYLPMQIPACRTLLQTVPPQSWISSARLWGGGWECVDTNMAGWPWNRSCWCSPADRCLWRRQIWEEKRTVNDRTCFLCYCIILKPCNKSLQFDIKQDKTKLYTSEYHVTRKNTLKKNIHTCLLHSSNVSI